MSVSEYAGAKIYDAIKLLGSIQVPPAGSACSTEVQRMRVHVSDIARRDFARSFEDLLISGIVLFDGPPVYSNCQISSGEICFDCSGQSERELCGVPFILRQNWHPRGRH